MSDLTNQITQLTDDLDQSQATSQLSPRSDQSKDSSQTKDSDSLDNYEFSHSNLDPALADNVDTSVILVKSRSLDTGPNQHRRDPSGLSESQDSGIGTLSKIDGNQATDPDKISIDSLDILDSPQATPDNVRKDKTFSVSEEITIDQSAVVYEEPHRSSPLPLKQEVDLPNPEIGENKPEINEKSPETTQTTAEPIESTTLILEKPKLSHDISEHLSNVDNAPAPKGIRVGPNRIDANASGEKQYSKFMSYVESAQQKKTGNQSPTKIDNASSKPTSFFVDTDDTGFLYDAPLSSKSIKNLDAYRVVTRAESVHRDKSPLGGDRGGPQSPGANTSNLRSSTPAPYQIGPSTTEGNSGEKYDFTLTTMEYKPERDGFRGEVDADGFKVPQGLPPKAPSSVTSSRSSVGMRANKDVPVYG